MAKKGKGGQKRDREGDKKKGDGGRKWVREEEKGEGSNRKGKRAGKTCTVGYTKELY